MKEKSKITQFTAGLDLSISDLFYDEFVGKAIQKKKSDGIKEKRFEMDLLQEECAELIQAVGKVKRSMLSFDSDGNVPDFNKMIDNISSEISHVCISIGVVCKCLNISEDDIFKEFVKKKDEYFEEGENETKKNRKN